MATTDDAVTHQRTCLVVGLGSPDRDDDAVGYQVVRKVRELGIPGVRVVERDEPLGLLDCWGDADTVVIVDAVLTGRPPGSVVVVDVTDRPLPPWREVGTPTVGLGPVVELARSLSRLPGRTVIIGVEADPRAPVGEPPSPPILATASRAVVSALADTVEGGGRRAPRPRESER